MRKLLQNPTIVASLGVIAAVCITANFVPWPNAAMLMAVTARFGTEPVAIDPANYPVRTLLRVEERLAKWRDRPLEIGQRDPFRPVRMPSFSTNSSATITPPAVPPVFVVQAISIEAGRALAVVNRGV